MLFIFLNKKKKICFCLKENMEKRLSDTFDLLNQSIGGGSESINQSFSTPATRKSLDSIVKTNEAKSITKKASSPLNVEDFFTRLASFSRIYDWFAKPNCVSPFHCARFGWISASSSLSANSSGGDKLECQFCGNFAIYKPSPWMTLPEQRSFPAFSLIF